MGSQEEAEEKSGALIMGFLNGSRASQVVHVAAQLGVADALRASGRPLHYTELASRLQAPAHAPSLLRLMRALTSLGLFTETEGRVHSLRAHSFPETDAEHQPADPATDSSTDPAADSAVESTTLPGAVAHAETAAHHPTDAATPGTEAGHHATHSTAATGAQVETGADSGAGLGAQSRPKSGKGLKSQLQSGEATQTQPGPGRPLSGTFALNAAASRLCSDHPLSLRGAAIFYGAPEVYLPWGQLLHSVQTGECAFNTVFGTDSFAYMSKNKGAAEVYNGAMCNFSAADAKAILGAYNFESLSLITDVGGGEGVLLGSILERNPRAQGLLVELPAVAPSARLYLSQRQLSGRCEVVEGSFLEGFQTREPADACILKSIVLNWNDDDAIRILNACRNILVPRGVVLVMEPILGEPNQSTTVPLIDINMLVVCPGGKLRTGQEHAALMAKAGLRLKRVVPTSGAMRILEGEKLDEDV